MATKNFVQMLKENPDVKMGAFEVISIDKKAYVTSQYLQHHFDVSKRQVENWKKQGLECSEYSLKGGSRAFYFDLFYVLEWHKENINEEKSKAAKGEKSSATPPEDESGYPLESVSKEEADRLLQIEKVKIERAKFAELTGNLIPAEDTDKAMAELGAVFISAYKNDMKILPVLLEMKQKQEITALLDEHYQSRVEDLDDMVNDRVVKNGIEFLDDLVEYVKELNG